MKRFPAGFKEEASILGVFAIKARKYVLNLRHDFMPYLYSIAPARQATLTLDDHLDDLKVRLEFPLR